MDYFDTIEELQRKYLVKNRRLGEFQINLNGFVYGVFEVIKPVTYFSWASSTANAGWIVFSKKNNKYTIHPNVTVIKKYNDLNAKFEYFGIRYCETDGPFFMSRELVEKQLLMQKDSYYFKDEFSKRLKQNLLMYDNNICFFSKLDFCDFNTSLNTLVSDFSFKEIKDTKGFKNCLYILVFDEYKQFYVGSAKNLSNRTKKHWNAIIDFGRFTWIGLENSRLNVDTFRMKDNTRIFVCEDIKKLLLDNHDKNNTNLEKTNTFGIYKFDSMTELEKAERIVINSADIKYCLSDRIPINAKELKIQDYLDKNC